MTNNYRSIKLLPRNYKYCFEKGGVFKAKDGLKTLDYYPSQEVIDKILEFESWHEGWVDDGKGNLTTGWGFKYTPELKRKYPNGMTRLQADTHLKTVEIPEKILSLKNNTPNWDRFNQNLRDALFDYIYNTGVGFYTSKSPKLLKALRDFNLKEIVKLMDADYNDPKFTGARKRREWEWQLFNTPTKLISRDPDIIFSNFIDAVGNSGYKFMK